MKANGALLYDGPSEYDGARIVAIVTGLAGRASANVKTGAMLQTWILRADREPTAALRDGADASICGDCRHRKVDGDGGCYVNVGQAPLAVWRGWQRGIYPAAIGADRLAALADGKALRLGSYGDPAAVPVAIWGALASRASFRTGYTHGWRFAAPELRALCMASTDSPAEALEAQALGWRTFRVAAFGDAARDRGEARCPASAEAGKRVTCSACPLAVTRGGPVTRGPRVPGCGGAGVVGPNVVIQAHGAARRYVNA